ncbi:MULTISPECIES: KamA family radical SAM protein [Myxococcus]|uniref:Lysine 2,3-aminomutase n=1 Tax=Myxococcus xanthus TaxID=34 RepID=A0AAE6G5U9_MYXXA|nr:MULTISPECIES: lysine 2,3-aminomutase [Myxococcus]QDE71129.1 lysine 2,3-aminomutase [Myxococcus xanthus]QDE78409.1 lysine 2,3-aminomutase [Myxococcus xanthus]QDE85788.1 lysine 2,3-aminomutase [Myxococcus xanthus]QDE99953.1 lysine 2,3-aminomutase [Myxococcus xanthus]QDF07707.1 lysine 2,3-aminomutase [Myxococcus xanthus]
MSVMSNAALALSTGRRYRAYTTRHLDELTTRAGLSADERLAVQAVAHVLPFRTNSYVVDELIDWAAAPADPIYRLVFPQADMLPTDDVARMADLLSSGASTLELNAAANQIRARLNPHPAGQMQLNVPKLANEEPVPGLQHKYKETVLIFPKQGQTCHAYCTYCFRWAQFVGDADLKFASREIEPLVNYIRAHPEVTNVLFTGGDPMIMTEAVLAKYIEPLLDIEHLEAIRIGTKALAYWPQRFVTDSDADDILRLFEKVVASGKSLAFMAHFSHPNEMVPEIVQEAVRRIRGTGAVIRTQAPLIRTINDTPDTWESMWRTHLRHGMVPYYMFIERDTGPQDYFAVPLAEAYDIFRNAYQSVSGLARTVRGPSMSSTPGKVCVDGVTEIAGEKVFVLHFIQARDPELVGRPFFAKYDEKASWLFDLKPALGATHFPWEEPSAQS